MQHIITSRAFVSAVAIFFGIVILIISLFTTSKTVEFRMNLSSHDQRPIRELFTTNILPGTPLYPFSVIKDWSILFLSQNEDEKIERMISISDKRISNAQKLTEIGDIDYVSSSASKAELYLGRASEICRVQPALPGCVNVLSTLIDHKEQLIKLRDHLNDAERSQIDSIIEYNMSLQLTLSGLMNN